MRIFALLLILTLTYCARECTAQDNENTTAQTDFKDDDDDWEEETPSDELEKIYKNPRNSPSTLCPRDEDQATLLGQKCLRKCSSDEDCKSKKKKCLCDGVCGMSCIKPDRECPEPEQIALGSVTTNGNLFGARATYTCQHGYHVVGLQSRLCQADGQWSGGPPACKQNIYCLSPPHIEHARHNALPEQTTFDLDSTLQYYCHNGYVTNGFPRAKCLAIDGMASWYGPDIVCEPRSCGPPTDIAHGWHAGECYKYGCRITYHCAEGFELVGKNERFCQADGNWLPKELPSCVLVTAVQCSTPEHPRHGKATFTSCSYNSVVSYHCKYGYTLMGEATRRCGADKKWTGEQPLCKEINCGHPGRLWNGWLENIEGGTGLGASIIFRCHEGMRLEGHSSAVCQIDGTWSYPLPKCLAPCVVPHVTQGRVVLATSNSTALPSTVVQDGESLIVECDPLYEFFVGNMSVICNNGTWTQIPKCQPARCKFLPKSPKNGIIIAPKMDHGMKAKFKCKDGFELKGNALIECSYGNWTGELPTCQEVYCPFPGLVQNGKILLVGNMGLYDYRPYVRKVTNNKQIMYDCDKGYVLSEGPPGATCVGGHWSPRELPKCTLGQHPRLRWSRRRRAALMKQYRRRLLQRPVSRRRRVKRALKGGGGGSRTLGLGLKGRGGGVHSRRKFKEPGSDSDDDDGKNSQVFCTFYQKKGIFGIVASNNSYYSNITFSSGAELAVICQEGFRSNLPVNTSARCTRGKWRPASPKCTTLTCRVPKSPNGEYNFLDNHLNSTEEETEEVLNAGEKILDGQVLKFACKSGYTMHGPPTILCSNGQWSVETLPQCSLAPCELPEIPNGQYSSGYRAGLTIANGSAIQFQCNDEYEKLPLQPVACNSGRLYPQIPSCRPKHLKSGTTTNTSNGTAEVNQTFYVGGADIIKEGNINNMDYRLGKSCGPPVSVHGSLSYENGEQLPDNKQTFVENTEITFNCIEGMMGERTTWKIICEDGSWIGRPLSCDQEEQRLKQHGNDTSCTYRKQEPNVISFYNDHEIHEDVVEFPPGAVILSRCIDIGKYEMTGSNKQTCINGKWDGQRPSCFGLNQENDYSMEKPPTILFRHEDGPIAQSTNGTLIVYPGVTLHMECLWIRRFGQPKWTISHNFRQYPQGWTTDPSRDSQLEYRLTIHHATKEDSGTYSCVTPARYSHAIPVAVKAIHCPPIPKRRELAVSAQSTKMNSKLVFSCINGNSLIGASEITCLPSGNWSSPFPICESVECGDVSGPLPLHVRVSIVSREVGGRAIFSCESGFGLQGPSTTTCLSNGEWATPYPTCAEVECKDPGNLENGFVQGNGPYKAGNVIQFNCNPDFMMDGQPILACQDNGRWSGALPKCVQACSYPGTTISGKMSAVKFYYKVGENITFSCDDNLKLVGAAMLKCLKNGKWSNSIPTCEP